MPRDRSPRPIVCKLCLNREKSCLFKQLEGELYEMTRERLTFARSNYFCMPCINKLKKKLERRKTIEKNESLSDYTDDSDISSSSESEAILNALKSENI